MKVIALLLLAAAPAAFSMPQSHHRVDSFEQAKRLLMSEVYAYSHTRYTIYCGCTFDSSKNIDLASCGLPNSLPKYNERLRRVEFEHAMPASHSQHHFACYREPKKSAGGKRPDNLSPRQYCADVDVGFRKLEADMHNLWPSVGAINAYRSHYQYGEIAGERRSFGQCDFEVVDKQAEPDAIARGDVARSVLYMSDRYGIRLSSKQRRLMEAWHLQDPPDAFEKWRNLKIRQIQGNGNPWIQPGTQ